MRKRFLALEENGIKRVLNAKTATKVWTAQIAATTGVRGLMLKYISAFHVSELK